MASGAKGNTSGRTGSLERGQRSSCVFCHKENNLKFLWCLHRICGACLDETVTIEGTVKCPNCLAVSQPAAKGRHLYNTLPTVRGLTKCAAHIQPDSAPSATVVLCDMCEVQQDVAASGQCVVCEMKLCPQHSYQHPLARMYSGHRVEELSADCNVAKAASSSVNCDLHPSLTLTGYCGPCGQLLCVRCEQSHAGSSHSLLSLKDAASERLSEIDFLFDNGNASTVSDDSATTSYPPGVSCLRSPKELQSRVSEQISQIRAELSSINDGVAAVSGEITAHFESLRKSLNKREKALLDSADEIGWKQSKQLDRKQQLLEESLDRYLAAKDVAECCAGPSDASDADVLRVIPMISEAVRELCDVVAKHKYRPSALCRPAVHLPHREVSAMLEQIQRHGQVQDVGIDLETSSVYGTNYVHAGGQIQVYISAKDHSHAPVRGEAVKKYLTATLQDPHGGVKALNITEDGSRRLLCVSATPAVLGCYLLKVMAGGRHLSGSPMTIHIGNSPFTFNSDMVSSQLRMSRDRLTVSHKPQDGNAVVVGTVGFKDCDNPSWAVRVGGLGKGYMFIGVSTLPLPESGFDLNRCRSTSSGWTSRGQGYWKSALVASAAMPEWKSGDLLSFVLHCRNGSLSVTNVSRDKDTVAVLNGLYDRKRQEGPLYFFAYLHDASHSIELAAV